MSELLWIHASGVCALALNVVALTHTCEKALRIQSGLAGVIWALNNLLLGAHTAAALSLVSAGRTATSAVTLSAREGIRRSVFAGFLLLTLAIGVGCLYVALFAINFIVAYFLVPSSLLASSVQSSAITIGTYATLAWGFTTMGVVAGALGSSLESDQAVRQAAYGYRESQRRAKNQEADK